MKLNRAFSRTAAFLATAVLAVVLSTGIGFALSSEFVGTWKTDDTKGKPMEITLSEDGTAKGTREGEGLSGKWRAGKNAAVITWDSGWTTKIVKRGNEFKKLAYEAGKPAKGKPAHRSDAAKVDDAAKTEDAPKADDAAKAQ
ncbi:MAG: hypothetical protein ACREDO_10475 [Methyloceanibacter sp.]